MENPLASFLDSEAHAAGIDAQALESRGWDAGDQWHTAETLRSLANIIEEHNPYATWPYVLTADQCDALSLPAANDPDWCGPYRTDGHAILDGHGAYVIPRDHSGAHPSERLAAALALAGVGQASVWHSGGGTFNPVVTIGRWTLVLPNQTPFDEGETFSADLCDTDPYGLPGEYRAALWPIDSIRHDDIAGIVRALTDLRPFLVTLTDLRSLSYAREYNGYRDVSRATVSSRRGRRWIVEPEDRRATFGGA